MEALIIGDKIFPTISNYCTKTIISLLTTTVTNTIDIVTYINKYEKSSIKDIVFKLKKLDLEYKITIIDCIIKEQKNKQDIPKSINYALDALNTILEEINIELDKIKNKIKYHRVKYFYSWRVLNCNSNIARLDEHKKILDQRYLILIDMLKINQ